LAILVVVLTSLMWLGCTSWPLDWRGSGAGGSATIIDTGLGGDIRATSCDADCPSVPEGWSGPSLFAERPYPEVPACPDVAPTPGIDAFAGLHAPPPMCPACDCAPSDTACVLPTEWHASAASCADSENALSTPFDAPDGWQGACTPKDAIPAGAQCGGAFCAQSVTVKAPVALAGACAPKTVGKAFVPSPAWDTRARECKPAEPGACPEAPPACSPPAGFSLCVHREGDIDCPPRYPMKHLFFEGVDDRRSCASCRCGPPEGNACVAFVAAWKDGACGVVAGAINVASTSQKGCFDVPPGFPLGGKTAQVAEAQPGSCAPSGGQPAGGAAPAGPVTVCCREQPAPG
jgi:hypothetical protein